MARFPARVVSSSSSKGNRQEETGVVGQSLSSRLHCLQVGHHLVDRIRLQQLREGGHLRLRVAALVMTNIVVQLCRGEERGQTALTIKRRSHITADTAHAMTFAAMGGVDRKTLLQGVVVNGRRSCRRVVVFPVEALDFSELEGPRQGLGLLGAIRS